MSQECGCPAIELSALRQAELGPMLDAIEDGLDLVSFSYVSVHAPSQFAPDWEPVMWKSLHSILERGWPVVVHPDALEDFGMWCEFGALLCVENMDKRKPIGRTARELESIFEKLPDASLCFDIGHARQCDPTMTEAYLILKEFGSRLRQVHMSEVNTASKHDPLSYASQLAFQRVAHLIPEDIPVILETPVAMDGMQAELTKASEALPVWRSSMVA